VRQDGAPLVAEYDPVEAPAPADDVEVSALAGTVRHLYRRIMEISPRGNEESLFYVERTEDLGALADVVAGQLDLPNDDRRRVLETFDVRTRLREVARLAGRALEVAEVGRTIEEQVHGRMEDERRRSILRERLEVIQKELGKAPDAEADRFRKELAEADLPDEARAAVERELLRLEEAAPSSTDRASSLAWLEFVLSLPWRPVPRAPLDLVRAREVLDRDHPSQRDAKARILEALAVRNLKGLASMPALCFVGPPGVGKSSLAQSVADALGREFLSVRVGGIGEESELLGTRHPFLGAHEGRILGALRRAKTRSPVLVLDGIDELAARFAGDVEAILLSILDPGRNARFVDHYLDVPFDLSDVLFIATANTLEVLSLDVVDRLRVIELEGYTDEEKVRIATGWLVPRLLEASGLAPDRVRLPAETVLEVIEGWTWESGVRSLKRRLDEILHRLALKAATGDPGPWTVSPNDVPDYLGPRRRHPDAVERMCVAGVAMGLAVTPVGGQILFVEAAAVPGSGRLKLTGSLGEVMKESAEAATTWLREHAKEYGDPAEYDLHVHVPAGAVPKDGPSAGVAMLVAIASAISDRLVRQDLAMTGEITLRGQVLPVGGIREKVTAAPRAGVAAVLLPKRNEQDLADVPLEIRSRLTFHLVERVEDALAFALGDPDPCRDGPKRPPKASGRRKKAAPRRARRGKKR
jgi:ATP-dependent Lon protease